MRRTFALLMFLILASAPVLDGGCFTSQLVTGERKEYWRDLHGPCAAYVGGDHSLTLVLPDREDLAKAKFFAVKFTPEEVARVARNVQGRAATATSPLSLGPQAETPGNPDLMAGDMPWRSPDPQSPRHFSFEYPMTSASGASLVFVPSRDAARVVPLSGGSEAEWGAALPPGGCWIRPGSPDPHTARWNGYSSRFQYRPMFSPVLNPQYQWDHWDLCIAQSGGRYTQCSIRREGGTYMAPTAGVLLVPVTLVLDVATLPVQLPFLIGDAVSK